MNSGPLVLIHPFTDAGPSRDRPPVSTKKNGALRSIKNDCLYCNTTRSKSSLTCSRSSMKVSQSHQVPASLRQMGNNAVASTGDLPANQLLSVDWLSSVRGHSDPNIKENCSSCTSAGLMAELSFNNCMYNPSITSPVLCLNSCSSPHSSMTVSNAAVSNSNWACPWQLHEQTSPGFNNKAADIEKEDFVNLTVFSELGSNATTIVNNRGSFLSTNYPSLPPSSTTAGQYPSRFSAKSLGKTRVGVETPSSGTGLPDGIGSSSVGGRSIAIQNPVPTDMDYRPSTSPRLNRHSSSIKCVDKPVRPSSDTNIISLTDNPGAPMLKTDSTLSLDTNARAKVCCFCWCCCCSCSCIRIRPTMETGKRSTLSLDEPFRTVTQMSEPRTTYDEVFSWAESFDNLMRCFSSPEGAVGQNAFREFLRSEYSEENILFWMACEDLKHEANPQLTEEKAQGIYEDYISILSPKEVSLDSRVREIININMAHPTPHTFDEAQLQIYTLMQRDTYPRFLVSRIYRDLLGRAKHETS